MPYKCHFCSYRKAKSANDYSLLPYELSCSILPGCAFLTRCRPFLEPPACWCTFMLVLSSTKVVSSTISCWINCARTFSHTPAFVHAIHFARAQIVRADLFREYRRSANNTMSLKHFPIALCRGSLPGFFAPVEADL